MNCFYIPDVPESGECTLPESEMHHAMHVLRLQAGDRFVFTNGKGRRGIAEIIIAEKKKCVARILDTHTFPEPKPEIHLALALLKTRDRMEFALEKCTEAGVHAITLIQTQNTERKELSVDKAEQVLISAIKQAQRPFLPKLFTTKSCDRFIAESRNFTGQKFIFHCRNMELPLLTKTYDPGLPALLMIGPEGDFSKEEIALAEENGFISVKLSETVFRSETAALSAVLFLHALYQKTQ